MWKPISNRMLTHTLSAMAEVEANPCLYSHVVRRNAGSLVAVLNKSVENSAVCRSYSPRMCGRRKKKIELVSTQLYEHLTLTFHPCNCEIIFGIPPHCHTWFMLAISSQSDFHLQFLSTELRQGEPLIQLMHLRTFHLHTSFLDSLQGRTESLVELHFCKCIMHQARYEQNKSQWLAWLPTMESNDDGFVVCSLLPCLQHLPQTYSKWLLQLLWINMRLLDSFKKNVLWTCS